MLRELFMMKYQSPLGILLLGDLNGSLCYCDWEHRKKGPQKVKEVIDSLNGRLVERKTKLHEKCIEQLDQYFAGDRKQFDLPLRLTGTAFQKETWDWLKRIPYGATWTYEDLSKRVNGDVKAMRAVATANGQNNLAIVIPCHRVIGKDGSLTGYSGGMEAKKKLLQLEGVLFNGQYTLFSE